jgi:hypothetical protein
MPQIEPAKEFMAGHTYSFLFVLRQEILTELERTGGSWPLNSAFGDSANRAAAGVVERTFTSRKGALEHYISLLIYAWRPDYLVALLAWEKTKTYPDPSFSFLTKALRGEDLVNLRDLVAELLTWCEANPSVLSWHGGYLHLDPTEFQAAPSKTSEIWDPNSEFDDGDTPMFLFTFVKSLAWILDWAIEHHLCFYYALVNPGYGGFESYESIIERKGLAYQRWLDAAGPEAGPEKCAASPCTRLRVGKADRYQTYLGCSRHEYEMTFGHPWQFDDLK